MTLPYNPPPPIETYARILKGCEDLDLWSEDECLTVLWQGDRQADPDYLKSILPETMAYARELSEGQERAA
jgi:hypothetical protein